MRIRGEIFWKWADPVLHHRSHDEELDDGTTIDVQVRLSRTGQTQMFIGVYARSGESMTRALAWGVGRARRLATDQRPAVAQVA